MNEGTAKTPIDILSQMYLPEFMTLSKDGDYSGDRVDFNFNPREPRVVKHPLRYLTPRGVHIILSQATYCLYEHLVAEGKMPFGLDDARALYFDMRLRIKKLSQDFRREVKLKPFQGRLSLDRSRIGKVCVAKMSFDIGNRAIVGKLVTVVSPHPVPATNWDTLRN